MNLNQVVFPVYVLGTNKPQEDKGVVFYLYKEHNSEGPDRPVLKIVDDRNLSQQSLAGRRLALKDQNQDLHKIGKAIFFLGDLIKIADSKTWFIDSVGNYFEYKKTKRVPLVFKPIQALIPLRSGGALVEVQRLSSRFKILMAPTGQEKWAGLLQVGEGYILYGLYEEQLEDTYRMI